MSSYRQLTNAPAFNVPGEGKWDVKTPSYDWIKLDNSIVLQSAYPKLFEKYGFRKNLSLSSPSAVGVITSTQTGITNKLNATEYGNNVLIIAGEGGALATSPDGGTTWTSRNSETLEGINEVIYANNIYVYVGNTGVIATSTDSVTWTARTSGTSNNINSIVYGNNTFVYVGDSGTLATSPDATTWTVRTSNTTVDITDISYGNGKFVYVGDQGVTGVSQNTVYWESTSTGGLQYVGGKIFWRGDASAQTGTVLTDLTGGLNSAPQAGDIVFVAINTGSTGNTLPIVPGYTSIFQQNVADTYDANLFVGYKIMGAVPDTTLTIPAGLSASDSQTGAIQVWRNVHPDIFDISTTTTFLASTSAPNPPSITPVSNNTVLLVIGATSHGQGTQTFTASYLSNFLTVGANDTNDSSIGFGSILRTTPGAYDPAAFTFTGTQSAQDSYAACTIALKPKTQPYDINAITYGQNKFIYVGNFGNFGTANDNIISFEFGVANSSVNLHSVLYSSDDTRFIWGSANGQIATSTTGNSGSWSPINTTYSQIISDISYGQKLYYFTYGHPSSFNGYAGFITQYSYDTFTEFILPNASAFRVVDATSLSGINNDVYIRGG